MESPCFTEISLEKRPSIISIGWGLHGVRANQERYLLPDLWCLHFYLYHAEVIANGVSYQIQPGSVSVFPPNTSLVYLFQGESRHAYVHFRVPKFSTTTHQMNPMSPLSIDLPRFRTALDEMIGFWRLEPLRAEVKFWDFLWNLAEMTPRSDTHPVLREITRMIELQMGTPLQVSELVHHSGISHNHLLRLFRQKFGTGIEGYIRKRRLQRGIHLLRSSTLPIKIIAAEVGIPDLQHFNKAIRTEFGASPRELRAKKKVLM